VFVARAAVCARAVVGGRGGGGLWCVIRSDRAAVVGGDVCVRCSVSSVRCVSVESV